ncbi:MAG TPA: GTPase ObgE [Candidatus Bathyarchaeia archaeon]|nr:GTPase ObgE [Candidatus Bathyarchaeia archaeon]
MIDEVQFKIKAGDGGNGRVSFRREKFVPKGGPDGGDGGDGGSVYLFTEPNLNTLRFFSGRSIFQAEDGRPGGGAKKHGKDGEDIFLPVPVGTVVYCNDRLLVDLDQPDMQFCIAKGGKGGRGNWYFRSSTNTTPREAEAGHFGEEYQLQLELKVLAQVGLVGEPNAGKSTLLSVLTKAKPKIASYPFTTLSPNLGIMKIPGQQNGLVIADIPGLIEGASKGKGLGIQFLKHIERCQLFIYLLSPREQELNLKGRQLTRSLLSQFKQIQAELEAYNKKLLDTPGLVVVNKQDLLNKRQIITIKNSFSKREHNFVIISAATKENIKQLEDRILKMYQQAMQKIPQAE